MLNKLYICSTRWKSDCLRKFVKPAHLKTHRRIGTKCKPPTTPAVVSISFEAEAEDDELLSPEHTIEDEEEQHEGKKETPVKSEPATNATLNMSSQEFETLNNIIKADLQEDGIDVNMKEEPEDNAMEEPMDDLKEEETISNYTTAGEFTTEKDDNFTTKASDKEPANDNEEIDNHHVEHDEQHLHNTKHIFDDGRGICLSPIRRTLPTTNIASSPLAEEKPVMSFTQSPSSNGGQDGSSLNDNASSVDKYDSTDSDYRHQANRTVDNEASLPGVTHTSTMISRLLIRSPIGRMILLCITSLLLIRLL